MSGTDVAWLMLLGLSAGCLGGLLGIGGSVLMIPVLSIGFGRDQHVVQAAAMIVNVFVAVPAMLQHHRARAVRWDVAARMVLPGVLLIAVGVEMSNQLASLVLRRFFGVFLIYVVIVNVLRLAGNRPEPAKGQERTGWIHSGSVGGVMGFAAGLLGIGGGAIGVPLLQRVCNLPLRQCIATSTAVMCVTAAVGATHKNLTLPGPDELRQSLFMASILATTAILGGLIGARLTHRLPLQAIRLLFILLMTWAAGQMLGLLE